MPEWKNNPISVTTKEMFVISSVSILIHQGELVTPSNFPLQAINTSSSFLLVAERSMFEVNSSVP